MKEKLLTTREVSNILKMSEKEVIDMASGGALPHFKVAGEFLRFKREDVSRLRDAVSKKYAVLEKEIHFNEKIKDFFYFNDFYIICISVIIFLLWVIIKDFFAA